MTVPLSAHELLMRQCCLSAPAYFYSIVILFYVVKNKINILLDKQQQWFPNFFSNFFFCKYTHKSVHCFTVTNKNRKWIVLTVPLTVTPHPLGLPATHLWNHWATAFSYMPCVRPICSWLILINEHMITLYFCCVFLQTRPLTFTFMHLAFSEAN